jgi:hypothetical protein
LIYPRGYDVSSPAVHAAKGEKCWRIKRRLKFFSGLNRQYSILKETFDQFGKLAAKCFHRPNLEAMGVRVSYKPGNKSFEIAFLDHTFQFVFSTKRTNEKNRMGRIR